MIHQKIRTIRAAETDTIALVAARMRLTLMDVVGEEEGAAMYSLEWLVDRVHFHLDPARSTGAVFVAEDDVGAILGHTIVRVEAEETGGQVGLFSTTYVDPASRRLGVAEQLLEAGEEWMRGQGLSAAMTHTSAKNEKLIRLYQKRGYRIVAESPPFVRLWRPLTPTTPPTSPHCSPPS
jgi:GNAT superfamily N-acetyltransferase